MSDARLRTAVAAGAALAIAALLSPSPAMAQGGSPSEITISATGSTDFGYASDWVVTAKVARVGDRSTVGTADGTVDVYADGGAAAVATALPIQADGTVYITQSASPALAAGDHTLTAVFHPSTASELASSQTAQPLPIRILPLTIDPAASLDGWGEQPGMIALTMTGTYLETFGAPAGAWTIAVTSATGEVVGTQTVSQSAGGELPTVVPVDATLERGEEYSVTAAFTPDAAIVGGVIVAAVPVMGASTQPVTVAETLGTPTGLDAPIIALFGGALLLLLAALAVLAALLRTRKRTERPAEAEAETEMPQLTL